MRVGHRIFLVHRNYLYFLAILLSCYGCYVFHRLGKSIGTSLGKSFLKRKENKQRKTSQFDKSNLRGGSIDPKDENEKCLSKVAKEPLEVIDRESLQLIYKLFQLNKNSKKRVIRIDRIIYLVIKIFLDRRSRKKETQKYLNSLIKAFQKW
jgi:hypothetical protein